MKLLRDRQLLSAAVARLQAMTAHIPERQCAVYVIRLGEAYKIGISMNPKQRIKQMMLPEQPQFVRLYWMSHKAAKGFERSMHRKYHRWREHGEWFRLPREAIQEIDLHAEELKGR